MSKLYVNGNDYELFIKGTGRHTSHYKMIHACRMNIAGREWMVRLIITDNKIIGTEESLCHRIKRLGYIIERGGYYIATAWPHTWTFDNMADAMKHLYINSRM